MFFAKVCRICGRELIDGERTLCLHCVADIPKWEGSNDELRSRRFDRSAPIHAVWPWLNYSNSDPVCRLIRDGKFNDRPELIEDLSRRYGRYLLDNGRLDGVEAIVPVPMHWLKRMFRGYNQAEIVARVIARESGIPFVKALVARRPHAVQSRLSASDRNDNVSGIFFPNRRCIVPPDTRIAVVDDILTTGATLSEAIKALQFFSPKDITVLTLAATNWI